MPTEMKQDTGVLLNNFQQFCTDYVYRVSVCARTKCQVPDATAIVNTKRDIARAKTALRSLELKAQA